MLSKQELQTLLLIRKREGNIFSHHGLSNEFILKHIGGINAENALLAVIDGDHRKLATIIDIKPNLMFVEAKARDIDGNVILTSPLIYALKKLDILALKYFESVSQRFTQYMEEFIATVSSVDESPNMNSLYEAYKHFIDLGKKYNKAHWTNHNNKGAGHMAGSSELEDLKNSWLSVGLQQRHSLPRHLLKDMCHCSLHDLIFNDVVLMRIEKLPPETDATFEIKKKVFEAKLKRIMKDYHDCPMILYNGEQYNVIYLGIDNNIIFGTENDERPAVIHAFSEQSLPFLKLDFPSSTWTPMKKRGEQNSDNLKKEYGYRFQPKMWLLEKYLSFPSNSNTLFVELDFSKQEAKTKRLFPLTENSGLGYDFALARGFCEITLGLSDPRGGSCFLYAKAYEDYTGIQKLIELRLKERDQIVNTYVNSHSPSL